MKVRALNQKGTSRFQAYIDNIRGGTLEDPPLDMLDSDQFSVPISWDVEVSEGEMFDTRFDMGAYLVEKMKTCDLNQISLDAGIWNWFALLYFDQLCPQNEDGRRKVREDANYVLSMNFQKRMRHAIRTTYLFVDRFGEKVRFLFSANMSVRGELIEQISQRQELTNCDGVIIAASILYNDPKKKSFKRGATTGGSMGTIHRFIKVLQQFAVTYDLYTVPAPDLVEFLPNEFERFRRV